MTISARAITPVKALFRELVIKYVALILSIMPSRNKKLYLHNSYDFLDLLLFQL
tara:strand:+ start:237 stop:398 length:162 start_codon:yes stop_codon:yes gene_type:complete